MALTTTGSARKAQLRAIYAMLRERGMLKTVGRATLGRSAKTLQKGIQALLEQHAAEGSAAADLTLAAQELAEIQQHPYVIDPYVVQIKRKGGKFVAEQLKGTSRGFETYSPSEQRAATLMQHEQALAHAAKRINPRLRRMITPRMLRATGMLDRPVELGKMLAQAEMFDYLRKRLSPMTIPGEGQSFLKKTQNALPISVESTLDRHLAETTRRAQDLATEKIHSFRGKAISRLRTLAFGRPITRSMVGHAKTEYLKAFPETQKVPWLSEDAVRKYNKTWRGVFGPVEARIARIEFDTKVRRYIRKKLYGKKGVEKQRQISGEYHKYGRKTGLEK